MSGSVITTVWIGVLVVAFFNLRLGWVLSGFVVPGYLVPLLMMKPVAFTVVVIESVLTYGLVWLFSEYLSRFGRWSNLFGRDRFFALFLGSIFVRVMMDGWLLPLLGAYLNNTFGMLFDYRNNLHSFGLVIVALVANQFWKVGVRRGLIEFAVTVGVTYLIIRFVLIEVTNFNVSSLGYMYEDIATSMLASPKAYIILIIAAFVASRMNLYYGWEFNGILIPALLALQWYQPTKIFASFIEAFVILGIGILLLKMPFFRHRSVEGAHKLILFFNVGFIYKIILGYVLINLFPHEKVSDFFAFGYVLSSLMAIKMHEKNIIARLTFSTLQASLAAIIIASLVGYALTWLPQFFRWGRPTLAPVARGYTYPQQAKLLDSLRKDKVTLYQSKFSQGFVSPYPAEVDLFSEGIRALFSLRTIQDSPQLSEAKRLLFQTNYRVHTLENRYFYLREIEPWRGWGLYVIDTQSKKNLLVEVPDPLEESSAVDVGSSLYLALNARSLAVSGSSPGANQEHNADVLRSYNTIYHAFHRETARRDVLQVRIYTADSARVLGKVRREAKQIFAPEIPSQLWVKASIPPGLNFAALKRALKTVDIKWEKSPIDNVLRDSTRDGFSELFLNMTDTRNILSKLPFLDREMSFLVRNESIEGYLQEWILNTKEVLAESGTNLYIPPSLEELLYFDQEVIVPVLELITRQYREGQWTRAGLDILRLVNLRAVQVGYQLIRYHHTESGQDYLILSEIPTSEKRRYGGTYIFRLGTSSPYVIQVPRPLYEVNSFEYGASLFEIFRAKALCIAGAHPNTNTDKSSDLLSYQNRRSLFSLVSQAMMRETKNKNLMVIQSRAFGIRPDTPASEADILVAFEDGSTQTTQLGPLAKHLINTLQHTGLKPQFVDGSEETAGYEVGGIYQAKYLEQTKNVEFAALWLSPLSRMSFKQQTENKQQEAQFIAANVPTSQGGLYSHIAQMPLGYSTELSSELKAQLRQYLKEQDVLLLRAISREWPNYVFERLIDSNSKQAYLLIKNTRHQLLLVMNLSALGPEKSMSIQPRTLDRAAIYRFTGSRAAWLEFGKIP